MTFLSTSAFWRATSRVGCRSFRPVRLVMASRTCCSANRWRHQRLMTSWDAIKTRYCAVNCDTRCWVSTLLSGWACVKRSLSGRSGSRTICVWINYFALYMYVQCTCIINRRAFKELKLKLQLACFHSFSPDLNGSPIENQTATIMVITSFVVV